MCVCVSACVCVCMVASIHTSTTIQCMYILYASSTLNVALRAQSVAVDEETEYSFPSQQEIMQLTLPPAANANISLDPSILAEAAAGS